jgi:hypothetical protein
MKENTLSQHERLTVSDFCEELGISRRTWEEWRVRGVTPKYRKLYNGKITILRKDVDSWFDALPVNGFDPDVTQTAQTSPAAHDEPAGVR